MADKMTLKEALLYAMVILADVSDGGEDCTAAYDRLAHEVVMLDKKRSSSSGDVKKAAEQRKTMDAIVVTLENAEDSMTATAIARDLSLSVQKVTAMLKKMVTAGEVERIQDGKSVTFTTA
jgi:predicted transcriptional regulator